MSMIAGKMDAVSVNRVWEEHVKKENRTLKMNDTFLIADPRKSTSHDEVTGPQEERVKCIFARAAAASAWRPRGPVRCPKAAAPSSRRKSWSSLTSAQGATCRCLLGPSYGT